MYLKKLIVFIGLLYAFNLNAQQNKIDSIDKVLKGKLAAPERVMAMRNLAVAYYEITDFKKAIELYNEALAFAAKHKLDYERAAIYQNKSFVYGAMGEYSQAIKVLDSALVFANKSNHAKKQQLIAKTYTSLSVNYSSVNDYKKAVDYQLKSIAVLERLADYPLLVTGYYNLSLFYQDMKDYQKQLESSNKALEFAIKSGEKKLVFSSYVAITQSYFFLKDKKKARIARDNALKLYDTNYSPNRLIGYHLTSGSVNLDLNEFGQAESDFSNSLEIAEKNKVLPMIAQSKIQLSRVLAMQKKFAKSEQMLKSLEADVEKTQELNQKLSLLEYYAQLYREWGKLDKALDYSIKHAELGDSIASIENKNYIATLEKKYETEKKDNQIRLQQAAIQQKNTLNYILIGGALLLMLILVLVYRNYKHRQKIQQQRINELETEKQLAATEAVLKGEEQERTRLAKDLHDGLGGMLSGLKHSFGNMQGNLVMTPENVMAFNRSMDMLDSSIKEMRRVAHNMMPEALVKFGLDTALKDFCTDINLTGALRVDYQSIGVEELKLDNTTAITIFRIVQELLNNTMKHAAAYTAIVQLAKTDGTITVTVEDDGKGFDPELLRQTAGIGWSNIRNRVDFLKGKIDVKTEPDQGASVLIEFKV